MTPITCQQCNKPITNFDQWYEESCPADTAPESAHALTWPQIMALQWRPVAAAEQEETK